MRRLFVVTVVVFLFLVAVMIQTSAAQDVISGCYSQRDGKLRIVNDSSECKKAENFIQWNVQGPQGDPGIDGVNGLNCWDLNGNQNCDLEAEDKNIDGSCDAIDCKEPVRVYDADDRYLGILLSFVISHKLVQIFIPGLNNATTISPDTGDLPRADLFYESNDCTGTPYAGTHNIFCRLDGDDQRYYFGIPPMVSTIVYRSRYAPDSFECIQEEETITYRKFPIVEIPKEDFPFTLPVALPLRYE